MATKKTKKEHVTEDVPPPVPAIHPAPTHPVTVIDKIEVQVDPESVAFLIKEVLDFGDRADLALLKLISKGDK